jgi:hypothetical protein
MKNLIYLAYIALAIYSQPALAMEALKTKQGKVASTATPFFEKTIAKQFYDHIESLRRAEYDDKTVSWILRGLYTIEMIEEFKQSFDKEKTRLDQHISHLRREIQTSRDKNKATNEMEASLAKLKARQTGFLSTEKSYPQAFARAGLIGHNNEYVRQANKMYIDQSQANSKTFNETLETLKKYAGVGEGGYAFGLGAYTDPETDDYKPAKKE